MVKIIFQDSARCGLKRVYGCERVLHCRWNIWFSLAGPWPVTHRAGLMQGVYPNVTLTIHLWLAAQQKAGPQQAFPKALLDDLLLCASRAFSDLPCDNCWKRYDRPSGSHARDATRSGSSRQRKTQQEHHWQTTLSWWHYITIKP